MKELNETLEQFVTLPRPLSLPKLKYLSFLPDEDLEMLTEEELELIMMKYN